ncbi:MAG: class I SAM-dependent methyltransferase [Verrucomicrobia bacterium]|nr:class I SAM-dependent methyltransferase [Verrucomicrobiota bacterium]
MNEAHETNRRWWEEVTPIHVASEFYDIPGFVAGRSTLGEIELQGVGDVKGKTFLHLQCHFGLDTLSWARLGAKVTGVDFSASSIAKAAELAKITSLEGCSRFVCSDVCQLGQVLNEEFDIVFTSHGVLEWLSDIDQWAKIVARFLKPSGMFFIVEIHPLCLIFDELQEKELRLAHSYQHSNEGLREFNRSDYTDRKYVPQSPRTKMLWPLAEVVQSLLKAGLPLAEFQEYYFTTYQHFPMMTKGRDGLWRLPADLPQIPLMFSLTARRPSD